MAESPTMRAQSTDTRPPFADIDAKFFRHPLGKFAALVFILGLAYGRQRNWNAVR